MTQADIQRWDCKGNQSVLSLRGPIGSLPRRCYLWVNHVTHQEMLPGQSTLTSLPSYAFLEFRRFLLWPADNDVPAYVRNLPGLVARHVVIHHHGGPLDRNTPLKI